MDELIELVVNADTRPELVTRVRALDRVLLHGHSCVPNWYQDKYRVAYWDEFGIPDDAAEICQHARGGGAGLVVRREPGGQHRPSARSRSSSPEQPGCGPISRVGSSW